MITIVFHLLGIFFGAAALDTMRSRIVTTGNIPSVKKDVSRLFEDSLDEVENRPLLFTNPIPPWLHGSLIRNGPSCFGSVEGSDSKRRYSHVFDGLSRLTSYTFDADTRSAKFSAKFLRSSWYNKIVAEKGDIPPSVTSAPVSPPFTQWQNIQGAFDTSFDNTVVHVHQIGDKGGSWVTTTDAPVMNAFDPVTLETIGKTKFRNGITAPGGLELFSTSHPKNDIDPKKQLSYNYFLEVRPFPVPFVKDTSVAHIVKTNIAFERTIVGSIDLGKNIVPYVHDISVTANYAILCIWPMFVEFSKLTNGKGFLPQMEFDDTASTKIFVFDLNAPVGNTAPLAQFEAPPLFAYHHVNAFESVSAQGFKQVTLDVAAYTSGTIANGEYGFAYTENMKDAEILQKLEPEGQIMRFELPFKESARRTPLRVEPKLLQANNGDEKDLRCEFCVTNPAYRGKDYRYVYGVATRAGFGSAWGDWAIVKHDTHKSLLNWETGKQEESSTVKWCEPNSYPSEAVFIPSPSPVSEDDGVLLSQAYDTEREESFLLILDAKNMQEISRAYLGLICPVSFHGTFIQQ